MKKIMIIIVLLSLLLISGCGNYGYGCGKFSSSLHEEDVKHLGQEICQLHDGCNYYDFKDICGTGRTADKIYCDCNMKTIIIN